MLKQLWSALGLGQLLLDTRRQGPDALYVGGSGPELLVGIPLTVGKHAGAADTVFGDPEDLGLGVLRADSGKLRHSRQDRFSRRQ